MFVNIIHFPSVKTNKDAEFREWFAWSNKQYAKHNGFLSRRLLKSRKSGTYVGIVEHESYETFMANAHQYHSGGSSQTCRTTARGESNSTLL